MIYVVSVCEYVATTQGSLKKHVEYKHETVRYPCDKCDHIATDADNLTKHVKGKNEVVRYLNYCEYMETNDMVSKNI